MEIAALSELALVAAVTGGSEWRAALVRGRELGARTGPVQTAVSATFTLAVVLTWVDEFARACELFSSLLRRCEERGEESALPWILAQLCWAEFLAGRWEEAERHAQEGIEIAVQADQEPQRVFALGVRALLRAARGDVEGARADAASTLAGAEARGVMMATTLARMRARTARALARALRGRAPPPRPARRTARSGGCPRARLVRFAPDEIEALIALGRTRGGGGSARVPSSARRPRSTVRPHSPQRPAAARSSPPRAVISTARSHRCRGRSRARARVDALRGRPHAARARRDSKAGPDEAAGARGARARRSRSSRNSAHALGRQGTCRARSHRRPPRQPPAS